VDEESFCCFEAADEKGPLQQPISGHSVGKYGHIIGTHGRSKAADEDLHAVHLHLSKGKKSGGEVSNGRSGKNVKISARLLVIEVSGWRGQGRQPRLGW
jgi:hypothetical protein